MAKKYGWDRHRRFTSNLFVKMGWDKRRELWEPETEAYFTLPNVTADKTTINNYFKAIKYSTGVTLSSITGKWDVTASPFGTGFSQDLRWTTFLNCQISVSDGTNAMTLRPTLNGYGTGEMLGTERVANYDFSGTWGVNDVPQSWVIFGAPDASNYLTKDDAGNRITITTNGAANIGINQTLAPFTAGALSKSVVVVDTATSGKIKTQYSGIVTELSAAATYTQYVTGTGIDSELYLSRVSGSAGVIKIKSASNKVVLTPDTTGFTANTLTLGSFNANTFATTGGSITVTRL